MISADVRYRFWSKVCRNNSGCWIWLGAKARGYGQLCVEGKMKYAHRISYEIHAGAIPNGLHVLHRCDNPSCVNPKHLFMGTHQDNMKDRDRKGRQKTLSGCRHWSRKHPEKVVRGERHGCAKLTEKQVKRMRRLHSEGISGAELGRRFGVSRTTACRIVRGVNWNGNKR